MIVTLVTGLLIVSCATLTVPISATGEQLGPLVGQARGAIILGIFGKADASIRAAAKNAGITQITSVDFTKKLGFLGLYKIYTVTVTGRGTVIQGPQDIPDDQMISTSTQNPVDNTSTANSREPVAVARANVPASSFLVSEVTDSYTVVKREGGVERFEDGKWTGINIGDILNRNIMVDIPSNSSLVLTDGDITITIPGNNRNRIEVLVRNFK